MTLCAYVSALLATDAQRYLIPLKKVSKIFLENSKCGGRQSYLSFWIEILLTYYFVSARLKRKYD